MIRRMEPDDLDRVMLLWLEGNLDAHPFIPPAYWQEHAEEVRAQLPEAAVYLYEHDGAIQGFVGMTGSCCSISRTDIPPLPCAYTLKTAGRRRFTSGKGFPYRVKGWIRKPADRSLPWRGTEKRPDKRSGTACIKRPKAYKIRGSSLPGSKQDRWPPLC